MYMESKQTKSVDISTMDEKMNVFLKQNSLKMQEQERERLARDLHDSTVQNLTHMIHKLEIVSKYIDIDPVQAKLELNTTSLLLKNTIREMRNLIFDLRPMTFDDLGFIATLQNFIDDFQSRYHIDIVNEVDEEVCNLSETFLMNVFRIIQEFCTNSAKHSKTTKITIRIQFDLNHIHVVLFDDGVGCDLDQLNLNKHYGLNIMSDRITILSGMKNFISSPGNGFMLDAFIPIEN